MLVIIRYRNRIYHRSLMQTHKSQPEMRFTKFTALSVDPRVGISWSASETDVWLFFLPMTLKIVIYYPSFLSFLTFYVALQPFPNVIPCVTQWCKSDVTSEIKSSDVILKTHFRLHKALMTIYWKTVTWDNESAGVIKRPLIFIQVEAAVKGLHTHNHLDKQILWC